MHFKCFSCGLTFDTAQELMEHKRSHKEQPKEGPKGPICLKCGKPLPLDSSKANYRGNIVCLGCGQTMEVVIQDGEVVIAIIKEG